MLLENSSQSAKMFCWEDLPVDHPTKLIDRRRIVGEQMMISHVTLHQGFHVPLHSHANEQISVVLSGRIRFFLIDPANGEASEQVLVSGQVLWLPSNVVHGATAEETTLILDLFSPPSETTGVDQRVEETRSA